ncbi:hypothetical protein ES705_09913 [subsurface metagenome]
MKNKLIFETIEGRVSSIEMFCFTKVREINFKDLDIEELIKNGYHGIFWDEEKKQEWIEEIIIRTKQKTIAHRFQIISLLILMLWGYYDDKFIQIWKNCIFPVSRIESFTINDFLITSISLAFLDKKNYKINKEVIKRFLQNKHNNLKPLRIIENKPLKKSICFSLDILNEKEVTIFDIGLIISVSDKLLLNERDRTLLIDIFCKLENNLSKIQKTYNNKEVISAVLFKRIKFDEIIARSKLFEGELYERTNLQDVHPLERSIPTILFFLIILLELLRFYIQPTDDIIAGILIFLAIMLFVLLINIAHSGELKINSTIWKIIEIIKQIRKKKK